MNNMDRVYIYVVSLGCAKNRIDTEHMLGLLSSSNAAIIEEPSEADVIIVNNVVAYLRISDTTRGALPIGCLIRGLALIITFRTAHKVNATF